jgi:hypothetical protein
LRRKRMASSTRRLIATSSRNTKRPTAPCVPSSKANGLRGSGPRHRPHKSLGRVPQEHRVAGALAA